jgi:sterol desaturase/sphingolipid hydroxylase (fatty acid hydroxylase superfamily)
MGVSVMLDGATIELRMQVLHVARHRHAICNFAVIESFWDRMIGAYRRPDA